MNEHPFEPSEPEPSDPESGVPGALWRAARERRAPAGLWPEIAVRARARRSAAARRRLLARAAAALVGGALYFAVGCGDRLLSARAGPAGVARRVPRTAAEIAVDELLTRSLPELRPDGDPFESFAETRLVAHFLKPR